MEIRDGPSACPWKTSPQYTQDQPAERHPEKVFLLGNSQTEGIDPSKFSTKTSLEKVKLYTLDQVSGWLQSDEVGDETPRYETHSDSPNHQ